MSPQAKLDAFKADFESGRPPYRMAPADLEIMRCATAGLIASGAADRAKKVGVKAPAFSPKVPMALS